LRAHRHNADTSEAIWATDDLAEEFERVAREARAKALKDAADWCQDVGRADSNHQRANAAFHCVSIIQIRSRDTP
jgi:gamma-glutamyl:cysteine ligase YbdK (ATP-grasp superfamily)